MYIRMAHKIELTEKEYLPKSHAPVASSHVCTNPKCVLSTEDYLPSLIKNVEGEHLCAYCDASASPGTK